MRSTNEGDKQTVDTYNRSAKKFAGHFKNYFEGIASKDVNRAFDIAGNPRKAKVVEIGCGAGKEASAIIKKAAWYEGFDPAEELLKIAADQNPKGLFVVSNALSYEYPKNLDIVFAFASLLHISRDDLKILFTKLADSIRIGGVICMTLKEADEYQKIEQRDDFGTRLFYLYNPSVISELAGEKFNIDHEEHQEIGPKKKRWFKLFLKRVK